MALIGDPRNDVHLFTLTLHVALLHAHNRIVDNLRANGVPEADVFEQARVTLTWHYQWIAVHDFLPRLVGPELVDEVLTKGGAVVRARRRCRRSSRWSSPTRRSATATARSGTRTGSSRAVPNCRSSPTSSASGRRASRRLDLTQVFDVPGHPPAQRAKRLDGRLAASLIGLPEQVTGVVDTAAYRSLAVRDLLRGGTTGLPSGEELARFIGVPPLTVDSWPDGTPLWFYILKESEHLGGGDRLGPVGGRIVAEVLIGLLRADPASYLSLEPDWEPTLPAAGPAFDLTDLLIPADSN